MPPFQLEFDEYHAQWLVNGVLSDIAFLKGQTPAAMEKVKTRDWTDNYIKPVFQLRRNRKKVMFLQIDSKHLEGFPKFFWGSEKGSAESALGKCSTCQGRFGNCFCVVAISAALGNPDTVKRMFLTNFDYDSSHYIPILLTLGRQLVCIYVNRTVPTTLRGDFAGARHELAQCPSFVEAAVTKVLGGHTRTDGGGEFAPVIPLFTGGYTIIKDSRTMTSQQLLLFLLWCKAHSMLVAVTSFKSKSKFERGVDDEHYFSSVDVLECELFGIKDALLIFLNPHLKDVCCNFNPEKGIFFPFLDKPSQEILARLLAVRGTLAIRLSDFPRRCDTIEANQPLFPGATSGARKKKWRQVQNPNGLMQSVWEDEGAVAGRLDQKHCLHATTLPPGHLLAEIVMFDKYRGGMFKQIQMAVFQDGKFVDRVTGHGHVVKILNLNQQSSTRLEVLAVHVGTNYDYDLVVVVTKDAPAAPRLPDGYSDYGTPKMCRRQSAACKAHLGCGLLATSMSRHEVDNGSEEIAIDMEPSVTEDEEEEEDGANCEELFQLDLEPSVTEDEEEEEDGANCEELFQLDLEPSVTEDEEEEEDGANCEEKNEIEKEKKKRLLLARFTSVCDRILTRRPKRKNSSAEDTTSNSKRCCF